MRVYMPRKEGMPLSFPHTKPHWVADSLEDLDGPYTGVVGLPNRLDWHTPATYDMSSELSVGAMYSNVIREAASDDDMRFLNRDMLIHVWRNLNIPEWIRLEWEQRHKELSCR